MEKSGGDEVVTNNNSSSSPDSEQAPPPASRPILKRSTSEQTLSSPSRSILRRSASTISGPVKDRSRKLSRVRFLEPPPSVFERHERQKDPKETSVGPSAENKKTWYLLFLMVIIFTVCSAIVLGYVHCSMNPRSKTCREWQMDLHYYQMRLKYLYYYYTSSSDYVYG